MPTKAILKETVSKIRDALEAVGRDRYAARIYTMATIITDESSELAHAKYEEYKQYASTEGALVFMSGWMGIDLSQYDLDEPIGNVKSNAIQSAVAAFQETNDSGKEWTVRDIAAWGGLGGRGPRIVGSGAEVADQLQDWMNETDVDGFNLGYAITPGTFEDIVEYVVPELQRRGTYPTEYAEGTLRNKLHGKGDRLPADHRGSNFKVTPR